MSRWARVRSHERWSKIEGKKGEEHGRKQLGDIGKDKSEELRHPLPEKKNLCLKNHVNTDGLRQRFTTVIPLNNKR